MILKFFSLIFLQTPQNAQNLKEHKLKDVSGVALEDLTPNLCFNQRVANCASAH